MKAIYIDAIGVVSEGIDNWPHAQEILHGLQAYAPTPIPRYKPQGLPSNERRRATNLIRLAFKVCEEVAARDVVPLDQLASIFSSSGGDYDVIDKISQVLTTQERYVSPTQFHNSVHNSAAGYWGIATGSHENSNSISAYDDSFFSGLIEAASVIEHSQKPLLLATYDTKPPHPLRNARAITASFASAFILNATASQHSIAKLSININNQTETETSMQNSDLETLRLANPAARVLPLLDRLANPSAAPIIIGDATGMQISIQVEPC